MQAFFVPPLEPDLKRAFICRSSAPRDTAGMHPACTALLAALVALAAAGVARAGEGDHDRARRAVQAGQVMPLPQVLERVARTHPGQVLEVELEPGRDRWVYEMRVLQADGRLLRLEVDARSGELLRVKSREPRQR